MRLVLGIPALLYKVRPLLLLFSPPLLIFMLVTLDAPVNRRDLCRIFSKRSFSQAPSCYPPATGSSTEGLFLAEVGLTYLNNPTKKESKSKPPSSALKEEFAFKKELLLQMSDKRCLYPATNHMGCFVWVLKTKLCLEAVITL